jgi:hypothetical protein
LEKDLKSTFPCSIELLIPTFALQPGLNWKAIKSSVRAWLVGNVGVLHEDTAKYNVPNVCFAVKVVKRTDEPSNFLVRRLTPPGEDNKTQLVDKFCEGLVDKNEQLAQYRSTGADTILLAESDDIALVNLNILYRAFLCAESEVFMPNINQVWMAHTYAPGDWCEIVCFLGPNSIMDNVNTANYGDGPRYRHVWISAMRKEGFAGMS